MAAGPARVWVADLLSIYQGDRLLPEPRIVKIMMSRDSDISFNAYPDALAHIDGPPLPDNALLLWDRSMLDVMLEAPIHPGESDFSFGPRFGRLGVVVTSYIEFLPARGGTRDFLFMTVIRRGIGSIRRCFRRQGTSSPSGSATLWTRRTTFFC